MSSGMGCEEPREKGDAAAKEPGRQPDGRKTTLWGIEEYLLGCRPRLLAQGS